MAVRILPLGFICVVGCFFTNLLSAQEPVRKHHNRPSVIDEEPTPQPSVEPLSEPAASGSPRQDDASRQSQAAPDATIAPDEIVEFNSELPRVKRLLISALVLTTQNLTYTYGSDDPAKGGMDCSGFTSYILRLNGYADVPRDASGQYIWLRKAGAFRAVLSTHSETFELDELRPGDLLFWMGTASTTHDPTISHAMIYLGIERATMKRIMIGSSDGRSYHGQSRWGVSIFDFQLENSTNHSRFVGYARPTGLRD